MLKLNPLFIGNIAQHFSELASSNDFAVNLLAKTSPIEGTVISTDYQTGGKGQFGSKWFSSAGKNLLFSLILYPRFLQAQEQFLLSQAVALAIRDWLSPLLDQEVSIKWPNDIYVGDKKIAGILIQNALMGNQLRSAVVGVGLNVNETNFPEQLVKATSLKLQTGQDYDLEHCKQALFVALEQRYLQLKSKPATIRKAYLDHLYQYQTWANYKDAQSGQVFKGLIVGVHKEGKLALQKETTTAPICYYDLKELVFL